LLPFLPRTHSLWKTHRSHKWTTTLFATEGAAAAENLAVSAQWERELGQAQQIATAAITAAAQAANTARVAALDAAQNAEKSAKSIFTHI